MHQIKTDNLIIGGGFAGLYLGRALLKRGQDFLIVAPRRNTVSGKSYFNIRTRGMMQKSMKESMRIAGGGEANLQALNLLSLRIDGEVTNLSKLIQLAPSYIGVSVVNPKRLLSELRKITANFLIEGEIQIIQKSKGVFICCVERGTIIQTNNIVFCCGGYRSMLDDVFRDEKFINNPFTLAENIGCRIGNMNYVMHHPFYLGNCCIPSDNLSDFKIINEKGEEISIVNELLEAHNAHYYFQEIVAELKKHREVFAVRAGRQIKICPRPHSTLGGIFVDKYGRTNIKRVFAMGECATGIFGKSRLGGCALGMILVMSSLIADQLS